MSTVVTDKVDAQLQNIAKQEAKQNLIEAGKDIIDNLKKIPESMDRNFHESLKKS